MQSASQTSLLRTTAPAVDHGQEVVYIDVAVAVDVGRTARRTPRRYHEQEIVHVHHTVAATGSSGNVRLTTRQHRKQGRFTCGIVAGVADDNIVVSCIRKMNRLN